MQSLLNSEADVIKELEKQYARALKDIGEKIKGFQADIDLLDAALNQDGIDDAAKAVLQSQKRSKIYQKQYQEALKGQVSGILDKMQADNYSTIEAYLKDAYEDSYLGTMYDLAMQGVPVITPINQASAVRAILVDSKVSGSLYDAIGVDVAKLKKTITQEISRGIASGLLYSDIARNIKNVSGAPLSRAKTITRTEGNRIQNTASRDAALEAKNHGADLVKLWDATLDGKTRDSHRMVDGEIRELNEKFSNGLDRPGDPAGSAAEVVNCRCKEFHKPRWDIDGGFAKVDNFTGETLIFENPKDYAEFKERYWSDENVAYMKKTAELQEKYGTTKYEKLLDQMSDREYAHFKKLEDASPMWKTDYLRNNLPKNYKDTRLVGKPITSEKLDKFLKIAESKGIQIGVVDQPTGGFEHYCGDIEVLDSILDAVEKQVNTELYKNSGAKGIILKYDNVLGYAGDRSKIDIGAFAETRGNTIILNKFMFDDSSFLTAEYADAVAKGLFVKGTNITSIIDHEAGHIIEKHTSGFLSSVVAVIEKEAQSNNMAVDDYITNHISKYASFHDANEKLSELVPELNSLLNTASDSDIIMLLRKEGVI